MTRLQDVEWLDPLVEPVRNPELEKYVKEQIGFAAPHTGFFGACPWIVRADIDFDGGFVKINDMSDLIYLVVSRDNSCRFCYGASRLLMRMAGMSNARIAELEQDVELARLEPRTQLALEFARRISRSNPPPDATDRKKLLEAGYDELAIKELTFFACDVVFHNRFSTLLALPPRLAERVAGSRFAGLLRLRFKKLLQRVQTTAEPEALGDEHKTGPYTNVVILLDGMAQARILRKVIDSAWASPHLAPRTKALVFAVIARGLESLPAEREARRLLAAEGLGTEQVDEILAHLASPELDPVESLILPYVRETIWYRPAPVQRRGRELREQLGDARFLETVGIAALANMLCRLAISLNEP